MAFKLFDMTCTTSCFCDSLTSKLLFMWCLSYFIHPLYPPHWGRRLGFIMEIILHLCNGINSAVFTSSKMQPFPLETRQSYWYRACSQVYALTRRDVLVNESRIIRTVSQDNCNIIIHLLTGALCIWASLFFISILASFNQKTNVIDFN